MKRGQESETKYWDERGKHLVQYKGEVFYTITPIPHYRRRRELLTLPTTKAGGF